MCAIFGLIDYNHTLNAKQREKLLRVLSEEREERGTDATGLITMANSRFTSAPMPLTRFISDCMRIAIS